MRILSGDIGGTKTRLALYDTVDGRLEHVVERRYPSREHPDLDAIIESFFDEVGSRCDRAAFGLAGPVTGRRMRTTNLPWEVDADRLEAHAHIDRVRLLNDLEATAWGLGELEPERMPLLSPGRDDTAGNGAVIAAGTGLGQAGMYWNGHRRRPFACEGGHATFSPVDTEQIRLLQYMRTMYDHVSWERLVSGPGLATLFRFVVDDESPCRSGSSTRFLKATRRPRYRNEPSPATTRGRSARCVCSCACTALRRATSPSSSWPPEACGWPAGSPPRSV